MKNRRTTFYTRGHGDLKTQKWLDSIEKQKRRSNLKFVSDKQTDRQAGRRLDSAPSANVVAMTTRVGRTRFSTVALNRPSPKIP